jgi:hypothetical protein
MKAFIIIVALLGAGCAHLVPGSIKGTCPHDFPIKGNVDSYIYHTPKSPYYYKTNAEVCFDSVDAAKRQGYIAPKR